MLRNKYTAAAHLAEGYFCMTHNFKAYCQTLKDNVQSQKNIGDKKAANLLPLFFK
jgi:hypothetical protein